MKTKIILSLLFLLLGCLQKEGIEKIPSVSITNTDLVTSLNDYITEARFILLSDSIPFGNVQKALLTNLQDLVILDDESQILIFTNDGKQVYNPILKGRASNEYISARDIALSGDDLIVLDYQSILFQSLTDKSKYRSFSYLVDAPCDAIAPYGDGGVYLFSAYSKNFEENRKNNDNLLYAVDSTGVVVEEFIKREDITFTLFNISAGNGTYYLRPQNNKNIFYSLEKGGIVPKIKIDFGGDNIPHRYFYKKAGEDIGTYMQADYYKIPLSLCNTDDTYYLRCAGFSAADVSLVFNRESGRGIRWITPPSDGDLKILTSDSNAYYLLYAHTSDEDLDVLHGPLYTFLKEWANTENLQKERYYIVRLVFEIP